MGKKTPLPRPVQTPNDIKQGKHLAHSLYLKVLLTAIAGGIFLPRSGAVLDTPPLDSPPPSSGDDYYATAG